MNVVEGDIVVIDESRVYSAPCNPPYRAIVLWNGYNNQPLITRLGTYSPVWSSYEEIVEKVGHIDLEYALNCAVNGY